MQDFSAAFSTAFHLIWTLDADLVGVVLLSVYVTGAAVIIACVIGFPLGAALGAGRFWGRTPLLIFVNALMGLPPVVVGLALYLLLSRAGPLGPLELLYTPTAMIMAQAILVTPIVAALTAQATSQLNDEYSDLFATMRMGPFARARTVLWDGRFSLMTTALAGAGRALAEVGAVILVGGNINHVTRVMTTTIALETSRGELALALGLGIVLLTLSISINAALMGLNAAAQRVSYA